MKLTKKDIEMLRDGGMSSDDIVDMLLWGSDVKCYIDMVGKKRHRVSYDYAIRFLGREQFLWAIHRAMYHRDCGREHISFINTKWGW